MAKYDALINQRFQVEQRSGDERVCKTNVLRDTIRRMKITCSKCGVSKPKGDYYLTRQGNPRNECKACVRARTSRRYYDNHEAEKAKLRWRSLLRRYGVTQEQWDSMMAEQGGRCAICRRKFPVGKRQPCVDHCHKTGAVRSILCVNCNVMIGQADDDPERLMAGARYLA